ncbi:MAG: SH3 domain-containing protein [Anaerolineae bacterium]|nr:SH3 domain-containing protein [Anaerolineae bacterium]
MKNLRKTLLFLLVILASCTTQSDEPVLEIPPTATLLPVVTQTIRVTETQVPTRTLLPTFTFTPTLTSAPPTETLSPTPTLTATVSGIVQSLQAVNVREGPSTEFNILDAVNPGTGVIVIGQNEDGTWFNVRLDDGREGWMSARLLRIEPTATAFPTFTATADLTAIAQGTEFPTAILGGGSVTPTPPPQVVTGTADLPDANVEGDDATSESGLANGVRIVSATEIKLTALALQGLSPATTQAPAIDSASATTPSGDDVRIITVAPNSDSGTVAAITPPTSAPASITPTVDIATIDGRDVFAFCDDPNFGLPPPTVLRAGDYIDIWWAWFASTEQQVQDHLDAASYELRINGEQIQVLPSYSTPIQAQGGAYATYWYVPYGPLPAGDYEITYVVTWSAPIFDGTDNFGPETDIPFEQETCTFTVR